MLLYHGTNEAAARKALIHGIRPRGRTGKNQWKHTVGSNPSVVYLTETYAGYFAGNAARGNQKWGIIEVDTDKLDLNLMRPDEDCLEQATRQQKDAIPGDMIQRTMAIRDRLDEFAHLWIKTLEMMGNCGYKGTIPVAAIRRIAIYDPKSNPMITLACSDPTITIMNHTFCRNKYLMLTRWLMGEKISVEEWLQSLILFNPPSKQEKRKLQDEITKGKPKIIGNQEEPEP